MALDSGWFMQLKPDGQVGVFYYDTICDTIVNDFETGNLSEYYNCGNSIKFNTESLSDTRATLRNLGHADTVFIYSEADKTWYNGGVRETQLTPIKLSEWGLHSLFERV